MIEMKVEKPPSLAELKQHRTRIRNVRLEHKASLKPLEKFAVWMTNRVGTMGFFFACAIMVTIPLLRPFKAAMPVIQYISSGYLQLILLPLIMVGQNLQSRAADLRAENDYEVNVKAEREVEAILHHLEYQNSILIGMVQKMGFTLEEVETLAQESTQGKSPKQ
jgi:uncharacterized membrane protein